MRRWIILLGRSGTVLLTIGLALLLVSLIPAAQTSTFGGSASIGKRRWFSSHYEGILTPQQSLRFSVTANGTLNIYLFEVNTQTIYTWIGEHHADPTDIWNITYLEEFLTANPNYVGWQNEIHNGKIEYEYVPTKITNTTLAFSNPSSDSISIEYAASITALVAPRSKVQTLAQWTIPIGFVLALPWLIDLWRGKTRRHTSQLLTRP